MIMYDLKCVPENLKKYRKQVGYSQAYLAEKIGMSTQHYSLIETGKKPPSVNALRKLSFELEIPIASLLSDVQPMRFTRSAIHEQLKKLSAQKLKRLAAVIEALARTE